MPDHIGLLPGLIKNGFKGNLITTYENSELIRPLLLDSAFIISKNTKQLQSKKYCAESLYSESDVYLLLNKTRIFEKNKIHKLNEYVSFRFVSTSHIVGATQIELFIKTPSGNVKKIHYSGDLSINSNSQPFVDEHQNITNSTVSIFEATYNSFDRGFNKLEVAKERKNMKQVIKNEIKNKRRILIPAFAMSRTQNILCYLYDNFKDDDDFKDIPVIIDGKLSLEINNIYTKILQDKDRDYWLEVLSWKNIKFIKDYETSISMALNKDNPYIAISSNGMATAGRIMNYVKAMVQDPKATILTIGYMGEGTIGRAIQDESIKTVKIEGLDYKKRCRVKRFNTWSSHIQAEELVQYMKQVKTSQIILHHSDDNKYSFRDIIEEELRKSNNTAKISCADEKNNIFYI